jgi:hypothetical protein
MILILLSLKENEIHVFWPLVFGRHLSVRHLAAGPLSFSARHDLTAIVIKTLLNANLRGSCALDYVVLLVLAIFMTK